MPRVIPLGHRTVEGIDRTWEEVSNFSLGDSRIVWNPDHRCLCGNAHFAITRGFRVRQDVNEDGDVAERREEVNRVVCPQCIDFFRDEKIIGEFDHVHMVVTLYDEPRYPTEDERRPGRWRGELTRAGEVVHSHRGRVKDISGEELTAWYAMMQADRDRAEEYRVALLNHERGQLTRRPRGGVRNAKVKPDRFGAIPSEVPMRDTEHGSARGGRIRNRPAR